MNTLILVALLGEASRAGITDITQKSGTLRFTVDDFGLGGVSGCTPDRNTRPPAGGGRIETSSACACPQRPED